MKAFKQINVSSQELSFVQDNVGNALNPLLKTAILDGVQLDGLKITTTATKFPTMLSRPILGWFIVNKTGPGDVYSPSSTATTISLAASQAVTVSIWIY